jgi:hypothetical protein
LDEIKDDLGRRINNAQEQNWLADVEQLRVTMRRLDEKRSQLPTLDETSTLKNGLAAMPAWEVPHIDTSALAEY